MNTASAGNRSGWRLTDGEAPLALEVVLHKASYILPWNQFLYGQGSDDELQLVFTTHDVIVKGYGLSGLLSEVAARRLATLFEPGSADRFTVRGSRAVRELIIRTAGQSE